MLVVLAGLIPQGVNPLLQGHPVGALNNGATEGEVKAVRVVVIKVCKASGMKGLGEEALNGCDWREPQGAQGKALKAGATKRWLAGSLWPGWRVTR
jgi:hypothetical protein